MKRTVFWLVFGLLVFSLTLVFSLRTYYLSQKKQEVSIAALNVGNIQQNPNPTSIIFPKAGKVRVYYFHTLPNWPNISLELTYGTKTNKFAAIAPNTSKDSNFTVTAGAQVTAKVYDFDNFRFPGYGWIKPIKNKCGVSKIDISAHLNTVNTTGQPVVSAQCWADNDSGTNGLFYHNYFIVFSYVPDSASPSPSSNVSPSPSPTIDPSLEPSPSPSASPASSTDPSASPQSSQTGFIIHKFLDANKNGVRETGEGPTSRAWQFTYQINNGEPRDYEIEPGAETGSVIYVDKGSRVKVAELGQEGWLNTTGASLEKTLADNQIYYYYFGNWPVNGTGGSISPPPAGFPPNQPNTGTPTELTVGLLGIGLILFIIKFYALK